MSPPGKVGARILEPAVPTLLLGCGLAALAVVVMAGGTPSRVMGAIAALCLLALWWVLRRQELELGALRNSLDCFREETMMRRSTMRFMFDELLDDADSLRAQVIRFRHLIQTSLNVASGFLELVDEEVRSVDLGPPAGYLREVRKALARSMVLVGELGRKDSNSAQYRTESEGSVNSSTVSV